MEPGFSTEQVTEVSGRGVGMDVVKKNISAMGGRIELESMSGVGTRITVRLPHARHSRWHERRRRAGNLHHSRWAT
jgi:chemotaxis protein histidine kinase CheA